MDWSDHERSHALEDARIANFPHQVQRVAHTLVTNRALAAALMQIDTAPYRYADICSFLDTRIRLLVESALSVRAPEPPEDDEDDGDDDVAEHDRPAPWSGDANAVCGGKTQKGNACATRAKFSHQGLPYCPRHYPYSAGYLAQKAQEEERYDEYRSKHAAYHKGRLVLLDEIARLELVARGLDDMNRTLTDALQRLQLPISETATPSTPKGPTEIVRVDGVSFRLEQATRPDSFWIVQGDDQRLAVLLQRRDTTWVVFELDRNTGGFRGGDDYYSAHTREDAVRYSCLYTMCYRLRRRRELAWFTSTIATLLQQGINITSPAPLETLCGISIPKVGWHVFRRTRGDHWDKFLCVYSGDSETEARWEYAIAKPDAEIAAALINPLNQVIDDRVDTKRS